MDINPYNHEAIEVLGSISKVISQDPAMDLLNVSVSHETILKDSQNPPKAQPVAAPPLQKLQEFLLRH